MTHKAVITEEEKLDKSVKIHYKITVDGEKIGIPELDGKEFQDDFDVDYAKYKDNERVKKHLKMWAEKKLEELKEKNQPSEPAKGKEVEL